MKIAIISDVHANVFALKAVLDDQKKRGCEYILCLGDYVGYYYWPNEVLTILRSYKNIFFIKGNHEDILFKSYENPSFRSVIREKYGNGIEYAIETITEDNLSFLGQLNSHLRVELDGVKFGLYHGSPFSIDDYIYPDAALSKFKSLMLHDEDVVLMGHTHYQFSLLVQKTIIINPGSVGQARDVRGLASYVVFNTDNMAIMPYRIDFKKGVVLNFIRDIEENYLTMQKALVGSD